MAEKTRGEFSAEARRRRAEEALKANLKRRKEQARARRTEATAPGAEREAPEPDG
jgi:hypothetical protein